MTKQYKYKNGEVKIIWDEEPMDINYGYSWKYSEIEKRTFPLISSFLIGLEAKIHRGGRICYGMLAARVYPYDIENRVKVSIAFTQENTVRYGESFLVNSCSVYKGLPEEYVEQIEKSTSLKILEKEIYPMCEISFKYAANCEIGSSPILFGRIAEVITDIISEDTINKISNMDIAYFTEKYADKMNLRY